MSEKLLTGTLSSKQQHKQAKTVMNLQTFNQSTFRCPFSANDTCQDWFKRLSVKIAPCRKLDDTFAFAFHAWCIDRNRLESETVLEGCYQLCPISE